MSDRHYQRVVAAIGGASQDDQLTELIELQASIIKTKNETIKALERAAEAKEGIIATLQQQVAMYQQGFASLGERIQVLGK